MGDIFDEIMGGADEPLGNVTPAAAASGGVLVVPQKAPWGEAMHVEETVFLRIVDIPFVIFESTDSDTGESIFANEMEYRRAMDSIAPVTIEAAMAWSAERVGAVFEAHREELAAADIGEVPQAPGAGAVPRRARMPHTTAGQRR